MEFSIDEVKRKIVGLKIELKIWQNKLNEMKEKAFLSTPAEKQNVPTREQVRNKLNEEWSHLDDMKCMYEYADEVMNKAEFRLNPRAYIQQAIEERGCEEDLRIPEDPVREVLASFLGFTP